MPILCGGIVAVVIGAVWAAIWWCSLLELLVAVIPPVLILGGAVAIYFGIDEIRYPAPQAPPAYTPKDETQPKPAGPEEGATPEQAQGPSGEAP